MKYPIIMNIMLTLFREKLERKKPHKEWNVHSFVDSCKLHFSSALFCNVLSRGVFVAPLPPHSLILFLFGGKGERDVESWWRCDPVKF